MYEMAMSRSLVYPGRSGHLAIFNLCLYYQG